MTKLEAFSQEYCQTVEGLPGVGKMVAPSYGLVWRMQQTKGVEDFKRLKKSGSLSDLGKKISRL